MAREFGIDLSAHRAQPLSAEAARDADAVIVMDYLNYVRVLASFTEIHAKVILLGGCAADRVSSMEIDDPYEGPNPTCAPATRRSKTASAR